MVEQMSIALKMNLKITNKQTKIMNYKGSAKYKKIIIQDFKQFNIYSNNQSHRQPSQNCV